MMAYYSNNQTELAQSDTPQNSLLDILESNRKAVSLSHFVEWFSGQTLDSVWDSQALPGSLGTVTFAMVDGINDGFSISVSATDPTLGSITTGNTERQFDPVNCVFESVQRNGFVNGRSAAGLGNRTDGDLGNTIDESVFVSNSSVQTFYQLVNINGLLQTGTDTSIAVDQIYRRLRLELSSSNSKLFIDGILEATSSSTLPDPAVDLYAGIKCATFAALVAEVVIRYMEVFNK